jgi:hypothetical protein
VEPAPTSRRRQCWRTPEVMRIWIFVKYN